MNFKERIVLKFDEMNRYLGELEKLLPETEEAYKASIAERRACEKTTELAIECTIDVMSILVSHLKLGIPKDEDDIIAILERKKILSSRLAAKMREMKGFRNILVHRYAEIDDSKSYSSLHDERGDFVLFEKEIKAFLKRNR